MSFEILQIKDISKFYGPKLILDSINLSMNRGERVALVGENGVGKTTLCRILIGAEEADSGTISFADGTEIGYLPQEVVSNDDNSIQNYIEQALGALNELREQLRQLEQRMTASLSDDEMTAVLERYGHIQEQFEQRGGYDIDSRIEQIFAGLGIDYINPQRPLNTLSGGERTRVALTALLLRIPDLLILDEPTNHLDFAGIEWLENYLSDYPNALLIITHDRTFINRVANVISELQAKSHQLQSYHGNYEDFLVQREREYQEKVAAYNEQKNQKKALQSFIKMQTHNEARVIGPKAEPDKFIRFFKSEQADRTRKKKITKAKVSLERLEEEMMDNPRHEWHIEFRFEPEQLISSEPIRLTGLTKSFGDTTLFSDITTFVSNGERVVLVAPNGTGKSTLLRLIMGLQEPDRGDVTISPSAKLGYLDQDGETLNWNQTVLESYREAKSLSDSEIMAELHRSGLFADAALVKKYVGELSVGQRRKLGLARIIASRANMLLLDEPTNHLDPLSLEALEDALIQFKGSILAVSHDRRFVKKVATRIWRIENQRLVEELVSEHV